MATWRASSLMSSSNWTSRRLRVAGRGHKAHHRGELLSLLVYGYATGVYSSRKIERATYDSVAFRYLAANTHPDHDTLITFRRRFLPEREQLFVQVLLLAREIKLLKLGTIALDGTRLKAMPASTRHCRMAIPRSWKPNSRPR